ncbi:diguanylate cyclase [Psychromonas sp. psych-6C06]|uniref:putative bifunctional diguanylate cyclase/phosphodiesterase n=1 Tax=Psychromonas sp. psych-6C06 TaxID=2058089 RepID=UPI000C329C6F|nr:EAL domain-containing protein [Psychromonas sp. psych-6C06]PKF63426.1 diguanylate cyclase [Psychromonas sp. psych-6C06]
MQISVTIIIVFLIILLALIIGVYALLRRLKSSMFDRSHLQALVDSIPDLTWVKDEQSRFLMVNRQFSKEFNLPIDKIIGKDDSFLSPDADASDYKADDRWVIENNAIIKREEPNTHENGLTTWAEIIKVPVVGADGHVKGTAGMARDITARKKAEEKIYYLAHHDVLTHLPNRLLLESWVKEKLPTLHALQQNMLFIFIDLDNFKVINDTLGHAVGDHILIELANRLELFASQHGMVSRIGGDEFVICLPDHGVNQISNIGKQIKRLIADPILYKELVFELTMSLGASTFPDDGEDCWTLVKNADIAMYHAKKSGKNSIATYSSELAKKSISRMTMEKRMREAFDNKEFSLVYQPKVDIQAEKIVGFEALLRWQDSVTGEFYSPVDFIPIAEGSGLILKLGFWVIEQVLQQLQEWRNLPFVVPIAVNMSAQQIHQKALAKQIITLLKKYHIPGHWLELELTESVTMDNSERVIKNLNEIREQGIKISIDDFGTGYSNLAYLSKFPLDTLKIDKSFIQDIDTQADKKKITTAIVDMAKSLKLTLIAEGVETESELMIVKMLKVEQVQGYLFDKPLLTIDAKQRITTEHRYPF